MNLKKALAAVVAEADYDIYKEAYNEATAEDPEDVSDNLDRLVAVFEQEVGGSRILQEIDTEMHAQKKKWGEQNHRDLPLGDFPDSDNREVQGEILCRHVGIAPENLARQNCESAFSNGNGSWAHILVEEVAEACAEFDNPEALRGELIQCAAVIGSWIEAIDRRSTFPVVKLSGLLMPAVHNGESETTIRVGIVDYPIGSKVLIQNCDCPRDFRVVTVTGVRPTTLSEITEEEFKSNFFSSREEFETAVLPGYPDVGDDSPMTVLTWEH